MMIRAIGQIPQLNTQTSNQPQTKTRYYFPQENKKKVENDFKTIFDKELERVRFDKII